MQILLNSAAVANNTTATLAAYQPNPLLGLDFTNPNSGFSSQANSETCGAKTLSQLQLELLRASSGMQPYLSLLYYSTAAAAAGLIPGSNPSSSSNPAAVSVPSSILAQSLRNPILGSLNPSATASLTASLLAANSLTGSSTGHTSLKATSPNVIGNGTDLISLNEKNEK